MNILVIDDETLVLETIGDFLLEQGHDVELFASAEDALQRMRHRPADVVLTDILMPHMDGIEFIRKLRRDCPDVWIIAMSGGGNHVDASFNLRFSEALGADRVIAKPLHIKDILAALPESPQAWSGSA